MSLPNSRAPRGSLEPHPLQMTKRRIVGGDDFDRIRQYFDLREKRGW